jgi:hypothetical protein
MTESAIYISTGILIAAVIVIYVVARVNRHNQQRVTALKQTALSMNFMFYENGFLKVFRIDELLGNW